MRLSHFAISQQGKSHIDRGANCQDFSRSIVVRNDMLNLDIAVAAIADGLGSCAYSEVGSEVAVTTVIDYLAHAFSSVKALEETDVLQLIRNSFECAYRNIMAEATSRELPFVLFDTTLTTAIVFEDGSSYFGHVGDDGIVALFEDGSYAMITERLEGDMAGSVIPLAQKKHWVFEKITKPIATLVLMTDGVLDSAVGSKQFNNRVFYPFFKPVFENQIKTEKDVQTMLNFWTTYFESDGFRSRVTDDITFAVIQRPTAMKYVKPLPFDESRWNAETEEFEKRKEAALGYQETIGFCDNPVKHDDSIPSLEQEAIPVRRSNESTKLRQSVHSKLMAPQTADLPEKKKVQRPVGNFMTIILVAILLIGCGVTSLVSYNVGNSKGREEGFQTGYQQGFDVGKEKGYVQGKTDAIKESVNEVNGRFDIHFIPWTAQKHRPIFPTIPPILDITVVPTIAPDDMQQPIVDDTEKQDSIGVTSEEDSAQIDMYIVHKYLAELGYLDSNSKGNYDDQITTTAVMSFQNDNGLTPTGTVDEETMATLVRSVENK